MRLKKIISSLLFVLVIIPIIPTSASSNSNNAYTFYNWVVNNGYSTDNAFYVHSTDEIKLVYDGSVAQSGTRYRTME